jgi:hypothetical protein
MYKMNGEKNITEKNCLMHLNTIYNNRLPIIFQNLKSVTDHRYKRKARQFRRWVISRLGLACNPWTTEDIYTWHYELSYGSINHSDSVNELEKFYVKYLGRYLRFLLVDPITNSTLKFRQELLYLLWNTRNIYKGKQQGLYTTEFCLIHKQRRENAWNPKANGNSDVMHSNLTKTSFRQAANN